MDATLKTNLIPVLRRPRRDWQIPTSDLYAPSVEQKEREAFLKAFCEGTTPYGRDIFRRILDLAARRLEAEKPTPEVMREVAEEITTFSELHEEFVLLLARTVEVDPEELRQCSPLGLAIQIVLRALGHCGSPDKAQAAGGKLEEL